MVYMLDRGTLGPGLRFAGSRAAFNVALQEPHWLLKKEEATLNLGTPTRPNRPPILGLLVGPNSPYWFG